MKKQLFVIALFWCALLGSILIWHHRCDDIACLRTRDSWFAKRYDPTVPLYLTPFNAGTVLTNLEDDGQRAGATAVLQKLDKSAVNAEAHLGPTSFLTCAVVGNSNNLSGSNYGALIDDHDYVFRMNNAPLDEYRRDVGVRTTHHIIHSYLDYITKYNPFVITVLIMENISVPYKDRKIPRGQPGFDNTFSAHLNALGTQLMPEAYPAGYHPMVPDRFPDNIRKVASGLRIMHPDFIYYINDRWFTPDKRWQLDLPSTGFKTLILALHLCNKVDVFGFGPTNSDGGWAHYYDDETRRAGPHRPDFQEEFLNELERHGLIHRYLGVTK